MKVWFGICVWCVCVVFWLVVEDGGWVCVDVMGIVDWVLLRGFSVGLWMEDWICFVELG